MDATYPRVFKGRKQRFSANGLEAGPSGEDFEAQTDDEKSLKALVGLA